MPANKQLVNGLYVPPYKLLAIHSMFLQRVWYS